VWSKKEQWDLPQRVTCRDIAEYRVATEVPIPFSCADPLVANTESWRAASEK
jgi:hypothetical protein